MGAPRAWGKKLPDYSTLSSPRHGLAGAEADEAVGTYSFGARTYDPTLRRWVSPDPLLAGLPGLDESIGDNLNLYAYAGNNPVARIDLTGFEGTPFWQRALNVGRAVIGMVDPGAPLKAVVADSLELTQAAAQDGAKLTARGIVQGMVQASAEKVDNEAPLVATAARASGAVPAGSLAAAVPKGDPKDIGPLAGKAIVKHVLPIAGMARASTSPATKAAKETGSYTNTHASGKTYSGKGDTARSQVSGKRIEAEHGDPHVATDWTPEKTDRAGFKQESRRIDANGGVKSPDNYNKIESPGKKYRVQDGD